MSATMRSTEMKVVASVVAHVAVLLALGGEPAFIFVGWVIFAAGCASTAVLMFVLAVALKGFWSSARHVGFWGELELVSAVAIPTLMIAGLTTCLGLML